VLNGRRGTWLRHEPLHRETERHRRGRHEEVHLTPGTVQGQNRSRQVSKPGKVEEGGILDEAPLLHGLGLGASVQQHDPIRRGLQDPDPTLVELRVGDLLGRELTRCGNTAHCQDK
jgi:hypothetical protein